MQSCCHITTSVYVGADLERLFADYVTHMACRAEELGLPLTAASLPVNLQRPPLLAPLWEGTVRDKTAALHRKGIGPSGWTPHWFRHSHATALLLAGTPEWVVSRRLGHAQMQTTMDLYGSGEVRVGSRPGHRRLLRRKHSEFPSAGLARRGPRGGFGQLKGPVGDIDG